MKWCSKRPLTLLLLSEKHKHVVKRYTDPATHKSQWINLTMYSDWLTDTTAVVCYCFTTNRQDVLWHWPFLGSSSTVCTVAISELSHCLLCHVCETMTRAIVCRHILLAIQTFLCAIFQFHVLQTWKRFILNLVCWIPKC